jgi:predicted pyridoxine 5'-phosphate oxidase superfamily flavin-nucleotide-binding protein
MNDVVEMIEAFEAR